ncbi:MAG: nickel transporter [Actinobacteria bacterium]|nr:nickel transporter [Actinomycetota bacterium]
MDAIPVLDLMGGRVVQGLRGERQHYRAVRSGLIAGSDPLAIAQALCRECDGRALYVADLDAIAGTGDHRQVVRELRDRLGAEPWVDAGVSDGEAASRLLEAGAAQVIVGTETLPDLGALRAVRDALPAERMLVSVDVGDHGVLSRCPALAGRPPLTALELLTDEGVTAVILLALLQVGTGAGPDLETLRAARAAFPRLRLIVGGGVRTPEHLQTLAEAGADGVLLATALHRGWITAADMRVARSDRRPLTSGP